MSTTKLLLTKEPINKSFAVAFGFFCVLPDGGTHVGEAHLKFVVIEMCIGWYKKLCPH
jgi:hypothetical protein